MNRPPRSLLQLMMEDSVRDSTIKTGTVTDSLPTSANLVALFQSQQLSLFPHCEHFDRESGNQRKAAAYAGQADLARRCY